ncbi:MAG: phosphate acetyltransferase [Bacteroidota bacterium]
MDIIQKIHQRASQKRATIVLPRSSDPRVIEAAQYLIQNQLCKVILIHEADEIPYPEGSEVIIPEQASYFDEFASLLHEKRKHKGLTLEQATSLIKDPLYFAAMMVAQSKADGCVAGSVSTTGDVLRAAIQVIGLKPGSSVVSSTFMMSFDDGRVFTYGDCAVVPYPDANQLASIAIDSAATHTALTGEVSNVALLSFSTKGSATHERIQLVQEALTAARSTKPDLHIDGELQFDAALLESIGQRKAPGSPVAGQANVFIFPNLDAGNIAYKITERLAGATATGPVIQGLAKPMMDLSRGCSWQDIVNTACVSALMS